MKWIAISGSWRKTNACVENDVRTAVREILHRGDGIVTGGAPGVDYFATDEVMKYDSSLEKLKIYLPTSLDFYIQHNRLRVEEGRVANDTVESLIQQLNFVHGSNAKAIIEGKDIPGNKHVETQQYYARNGLIVDSADELVAFHVNESEGTKDALEKAKTKIIPMKVFSYKID